MDYRPAICTEGLVWHQTWRLSLGEGGQNLPILVLQLHIWIYPSCHIGLLAGMSVSFATILIA
jgi:hypothetical protein